MGFSGFRVQATFDSVVFSGNLATGGNGNALYLSGGNEGDLGWVGGNKISMCDNWYEACENTHGPQGEPEPGLLGVGKTCYGGVCLEGGCYAEDFRQSRVTDSGDSYCPSACYDWRIPGTEPLVDTDGDVTSGVMSRSTRALFDSTIVPRA